MELIKNRGGSSATELEKKIKKKGARVGIVGVGYVGQVLGETIARERFFTIGFDIDQKKVRAIQQKGLKYFLATKDFSKIALCDIVVICVPTPLTEKRQPDLTFVKKAAETISRYLHRGKLVILESSVAPGTTKNILLPMFEKKGLKAEEDFFLAVSPERVDPGNRKFTIKNTPKVVAGVGERSTYLASLFYQSFIKKVHAVHPVEVAEMSKMLENAFRLVNISLVNELSEYARGVGINIMDVIHAASTKPFAFLPHYPGPGAGGHCIPVDPYYLLHSPWKNGAKLALIKEALKINEQRPKKVVDRAYEILNGKGKKPKILLVGLSYKKDSDDIRESASLKIWQELEKRGAQIAYHDPYVRRFNGERSTPLSKRALLAHDLIVIATDHGNLPYQLFARIRTPILDTRHTLPNNPFPHIFYV